MAVFSGTRKNRPQRGCVGSSIACARRFCVSVLYICVCYPLWELRGDNKSSEELKGRLQHYNTITTLQQHRSREAARAVTGWGRRDASELYNVGRCTKRARHDEGLLCIGRGREVSPARLAY